MSQSIPFLESAEAQQGSVESFARAVARYLAEHLDHRVTDDLEALLTLRSAAALAACSLDTISRACATGALARVELGRRAVRVRRGDLLRWIAARRVPARGEVQR